MTRMLLPALLGLALCACAETVSSGVVEHLPVPQHPHLAPNGRSNMHNDAYMTDTYEWAGPGPQAEVTLRSYGDTLNTCATIAFDAQGRLLTTSAAMLEFTILLIDPDTLEPLASYPLPPRDPSDPLFPYDDTSGATYFVIDSAERIIFADAENAVQVIRFDEQQGQFVQLERYDLSDHVVQLTPPARDHVQMAIPDWSGRHLWFVTRYGTVGTIDTTSGAVRSLELNGEEMENSFAVGEDGAYIVSDHAMYRFSVGPDGAPRQDWRTPYDRGSEVKPGNFNQGSGTTPQLFGDMVAICDNAEPRMHVLFLRREDGSVACSLPVFADGASTTENALPGWVRRGPQGLEYSVIIDNNYGIDRNNILGEGRAWSEHAGTLDRVDMVPDGAGSFDCHEVWRSPEHSSQVLPKLSFTSGLLYLYTYEPAADGDYDFALTAIDFSSGERVFSLPTGHGLDYANFGQPMSLGSNGSAWLGTMKGLLRISDPPQEP